jgi:hypothetical protein
METGTVLGDYGRQGAEVILLWLLAGGITYNRRFLGV